MKVVLIHGLGRSGLCFLPLALYLKANSFEPIVYDYPSTKLSLQDQAARLRDFLARKKLLHSKLNFVTHSLGSIVLLSMEELYPEDFGFGSAVMLAPPNTGSSLANGLSKLPLFSNLLGPAFRQLAQKQPRSYSGRLKIGIIAGDLPNLGRLLPFVSYPNDGIVAREETLLPGAKDWMQVRGVHTFLMYRPSLMKQIAYFLQNTEFKKTPSFK